MEIPILDGIDANDIWFQQVGATCHTSHASIDLLPQTLDILLIRIKKKHQLATKKLQFDSV